MSKSILSCLSVAALAGGAMLALELSPASAFTLSGTSSLAARVGREVARRLSLATQTFRRRQPDEVLRRLRRLRTRPPSLEGRRRRSAPKL
jgi:hypothetical protein